MLDKELMKSVADKIKRANEGVIITRVARKNINVLHTMKVSKGNTTYPEVSLVNVDDEYVLLQHDKGRIPLSREWIMKHITGVGRGFMWCKLNAQDVAILSKVMSLWDEHQNSSLTGFTFLIAGCLAEGLDLVRAGLMEY